MEEFKDTREGFLTPEEEQILDDLYEAKGIIEALDGMVIRIADMTKEGILLHSGNLW